MGQLFKLTFFYSTGLQKQENVSLPVIVGEGILPSFHRKKDAGSDETGVIIFHVYSTL